AAGGSGAGGGALRSWVSQRVSASLSSEGQGSGQSGSSAEVGHTTVLDAAHPHTVSGSRSYREQPAGAPGRQKLDRRTDWALSHPRRNWMVAQKNHGRSSWVESMAGGTTLHRVSDSA